MLQAHNRTAKAISTKYQRYLRFNYRQITNDPAVAMKIETMEIERSIK
uniref:Uncharacterized protein n=1 Tax=Bracon brevicornis TaxID=1563983 RepID=A0A6V7LV91_9HYME